MARGRTTRSSRTRRSSSSSSSSSSAAAAGAEQAKDIAVDVVDDSSDEGDDVVEQQEESPSDDSSDSSDSDDSSSDSDDDDDDDDDALIDQFASRLVEEMHGDSFKTNIQQNRVLLNSRHANEELEQQERQERHAQDEADGSILHLGTDDTSEPNNNKKKKHDGKNNKKKRKHSSISVRAEELTMERDVGKHKSFFKKGSDGMFKLVESRVDDAELALKNAASASRKLAAAVDHGVSDALLEQEQEAIDDSARRKRLRIRKGDNKRGDASAKRSGKQWFDMASTEMTPEVRTDLRLLQMRNYLDPKRFYKRDKGRKRFPDFFQIGTVIDSKADYYSTTLTKKQRQKSLLQELMHDDERRTYLRKRFTELQRRSSDGVRRHRGKKNKSNSNKHRRHKKN